MSCYQHLHAGTNDAGSLSSTSQMLRRQRHGSLCTCIPLQHTYMSMGRHCLDIHQVCMCACRGRGQENKGGRVRELESQLEEVRSHYHHRLRSLENQLQVTSLWNTPPTSPLTLGTTLDPAHSPCLAFFTVRLVLETCLQARHGNMGGDPFDDPCTCLSAISQTWQSAYAPHLAQSMQQTACSTGS